ncbi:unnamed protein product, partial [Coregonus sp. 'balchen']
VRNYLKEALVNIITVHAEVFTVSKDLVPRVLTRIIEGVAEEMSRLMQCVSSFSKDGAIQVHTHFQFATLSGESNEDPLPQLGGFTLFY